MYDYISGYSKKRLPKWSIRRFLAKLERVPFRSQLYQQSDFQRVPLESIRNLPDEDVCKEETGLELIHRIMTCVAIEMSFPPSCVFQSFVAFHSNLPSNVEYCVPKHTDWGTATLSCDCSGSLYSALADIFQRLKRVAFSRPCDRHINTEICLGVEVFHLMHCLNRKYAPSFTMNYKFVAETSSKYDVTTFLHVVCINERT